MQMAVQAGIGHRINSGWQAEVREPAHNFEMTIEACFAQRMAVTYVVHREPERGHEPRCHGQVATAAGLGQGCTGIVRCDLKCGREPRRHGKAPAAAGEAERSAVATADILGHEFEHGHEPLGDVQVAAIAGPC